MGPDMKVGYFRKDVPSLPFSRLGPGGIGYERGIYSFQGVKEAEINLPEDRILSPIDYHAGKVINKLIEFGPDGLSKLDFRWLFIFKASLEIRNPKKLKGIQDMAHSLLMVYRGESEVEREVLEYIEGHPELSRNLPLQNLGVIICNTARTFQRELKYWGVVDFPGRKRQLLLSDFPFIRTFGVCYPNSVCALPLSPWKVALGFKTIETGKIYVHGISRRVLLSLINESSFAQATRYIYALDETPRRFLENRLRAEVPS